MKLEILLEHVQSLIKSEGSDAPCAFAIWLTDDVVDANKYYYDYIDHDDPASEVKDLTSDEIETVLSEVHKNHDAEYGITWDSIKTEIKNLKV